MIGGTVGRKSYVVEVSMELGDTSTCGVDEGINGEGVEETVASEYSGVFSVVEGDKGDLVVVLNRGVPRFGCGAGGAGVMLYPESVGADFAIFSDS